MLEPQMAAIHSLMAYIFDRNAALLPGKDRIRKNTSLECRQNQSFALKTFTVILNTVLW
jgi:hypothetical protein